MFDLLVKRREMLLRMARERAEAEAKAAAEADVYKRQELTLHNCRCNRS